MSAMEKRQFYKSSVRVQNCDAEVDDINIPQIMLYWEGSHESVGQ